MRRELAPTNMVGVKRGAERRVKDQGEVFISSSGSNQRESFINHADHTWLSRCGGPSTSFYLNIYYYHLFFFIFFFFGVRGCVSGWPIGWGGGSVLIDDISESRCDVSGSRFYWHIFIGFFRNCKIKKKSLKFKKILKN